MSRLIVYRFFRGDEVVEILGTPKVAGVYEAACKLALHLAQSNRQGWTSVEMGNFGSAVNIQFKVGAPLRAISLRACQRSSYPVMIEAR